MAEAKEQVTITSPLGAWQGEIKLPHPDDFNGLAWATWREAVDTAKRKKYAVTHLYAYAGLELIAKHGEWQMEIPLEDVQAWEDDPESERIKLVAWIGRELITYMTDILDPKG